MNRLVFGAGVLMLMPVFSGCGGKFYLTAPPAPEPTATKLPPVPPFPFDETAGIEPVVGAGTGRKMNTEPDKFRVAIVDDIRTIPSRENDPANAFLLLTLQKITAGAATAAGAAAAPGAGAVAAPAAPAYVAGTRDTFHLAGIIVPGAGGNVGGGLQDADEQALLLQASTKMRQTLVDWLVFPPPAPAATPAPGTTPLPTPTIVPTPTPTSAPRRGAVAGATPAPVLPSIINPELLLDVVQDPQFPVDTQNRPLVQVFFKAPRGGENITKGMRLSLNRMLVRSGLAVVDLYSPTSFDQKTWLLDEAYARSRRLGMWGMQLNGKKLVIQQRPPTPSTGTGSKSNVPVQANAPGGPISSPTPITSATQSPATLTPTVRPLPATIPRVVPRSGSSIQRGPTNKAVLPPPSAAAPAAPVAGTDSAAGGNTAAP